MTNGSDFRSHGAALENWLAPLFDKLPHLPEDARKTIVGIAPWLALIAGILGLYGVFMGLSLVSYVTSFAYMGMMGGWYPAMLLSLITMGLAAVLDLLAFKPLSAHKKQGWNLLFYGVTLSAISSILTLFFGYGGGFAWIIGIVIGYWLLFEIRGHYKA